MRRFEIAIIGAGFAGIGAAWQLIARGLTDFVVLERGSEVGGTWRDNTYPGAACDIQSDLYSFSFAPNPGWSSIYGRQPEILEYLQHVSSLNGVRRHIRFDSDVLGAHWDVGSRHWTIQTTGGEVTARLLLSGHGPFSDPRMPDIDGIESFAGAVFHSSRWDHRVDLSGKRVGVIGTGASAIQIVPAVQPVVERLTLFQRTAPWIIPRGDRPTSLLRRRMFAAMPALQRLSRSMNFTADDVRWFGFTRPRIGAVLERYSAHHLRSQVSDPQLCSRLRPDYRIGCKRVLVSDDFYPALQRENVDLVTESIRAVEHDGVVTSTGSHVPLDVLVLATGFDATAPSIAERIVGEDGTTLAKAWSGGMFALRGSTVPRFPNLFLLHGPNAALSHNSAVYMIEQQIAYAMQAITAVGPDAVVSPTEEATRAYNEWLDGFLKRGVWSTGGCTSFYLDPGGRNTVLWPRRANAFPRALRRFDPAEYSIS